MKLYRRENYLKKIRGFYHDTGMIKVITGVRRCGKSCLMQTIAEEITESGVPAENDCRQERLLSFCRISASVSGSR